MTWDEQIAFMQQQDSTIDGLRAGLAAARDETERTCGGRIETREVMQ
jgi:hypothetical protein